jgi:hypothetical protein
MPLIKGIRCLPIQGLYCVRVAQVILSFLFLFVAGSAEAESCIAPTRPFVPPDPQDVRDYADIIRKDFELYLRDIQGYFRCLEVERARAFQEAREVTEDYGRFLELVDQ